MEDHMTDRLISCDDHMDLSQLPADLWSTRLPASLLYHAFDRAGIHDQSARRPAVAELRLADMDREGIETQVIFGPIFQISTDDPVLRSACYRVYNDWLLDFCKAPPDRLIGLPMLPE